jgi:hypothetical protein
MKDTDRVINEAFKLNDKDLMAVAKELWREVKARRRDNSQKELFKFTRGDLVENIHGGRSLPSGAIGRVMRLGSVNLTVDFGFYKTWRCPATMLKPAAPGAKIEK